MSLKLITAPVDFPISLAEAKAHLREEHSITDFDTEIEAFIEAATDYCEGPSGFLGRALIDQTWQLTLDSFQHHGHHNEIKIPLPPLIEIVSVKYDDTAGDEQTLSTSGYSVDSSSEPGWILPVGSWPSTFCGVNAVRIQFRCGYLDQSASPPVANVPAAIKAAIKLIVGTLYLNRENDIIGDTVATIPFSAQLLLKQYRIQLGMA